MNRAPILAGRTTRFNSCLGCGRLGRAPEVDRTARVAHEGKLDAPPLPRRGVERPDDLHDGPAVVAVFAGYAATPDAVDEMLHLLGKSVIPDLFVDRKRPAL